MQDLVVQLATQSSGAEAFAARRVHKGFLGVLTISIESLKSSKNALGKAELIVRFRDI